MTFGLYVRDNPYTSVYVAKVLTKKVMSEDNACDRDPLLVSLFIPIQAALLVYCDVKSVVSCSL